MPISRKVTAMFLTLFGTTAVLAQQQGSAPMTEEDAIRAAYESSVDPTELFSVDFLSEVSAAQVKAIADEFNAKMGPIADITGSDGTYVLTTATHRMDVKINLAASGRISGLLFGTAEELTETLDDTLTAFAKLGDETSYVLLRNNQAIKAKASKQPLAVGSAFKLGVLKVLKDDIASGRTQWRDVFELLPEDKSLPSGELHLYPDKAPFTLHTLASLMIAESDNTATDILMRVVGADRVAEALGIDIALTTKQLFAFKHDAALRERYETATRDERLALLADIQATPLPERIQIGHHNQGFEWYVKEERLCALLEDIGPLDVFQINAGPLSDGDWQKVRFKGGSEDGVLNLTAHFAKGGDSYCLSITVNHSGAIDAEKMQGLFKRAARQLAELN